MSQSARERTWVLTGGDPSDLTEPRHYRSSDDKFELTVYGFRGEPEIWGSPDGPILMTTASITLLTARPRGGEQPELWAYLNRNMDSWHPVCYIHDYGRDRHWSARGDNWPERHSDLFVPLRAMLCEQWDYEHANSDWYFADDCPPSSWVPEYEPGLSGGAAH